MINCVCMMTMDFIDLGIVCSFDFGYLNKRVDLVS